MSNVSGGLVHTLKGSGGSPDPTERIVADLQIRTSRAAIQREEGVAFLAASFTPSTVLAWGGFAPIY